MTPAAPIETDLVLVGGGHAHVTVLRMFAMVREKGLRITLIAKELDAPYSGMLPGLVAGRYSPDECHIDLARLAAFAGARLIHGVAERIDPAARQVIVPGRPPIAYDLLSIDVGITPKLDDIPGAAEHAIAVKPVSTFWPRWSALLDAALMPGGPRRFAVVGGGAAGFELVLAIAARLREAAGGHGLAAGDFGFTLVAGDGLLPGINGAARAHARAALARARIDLLEGDPAAEVTADRLRLASGREMLVDAALVTTRAGPPPLLRAGTLPLAPDGFLATRATLQLVGHDDVFAVGDSAHVLDHPRPKAGVFAVRQGPALVRNLRRRMRGEPVRAFRPQSKFLMLLSTGDGRAIAARGAFAAEGTWVWRWKDRIDTRFMALFNDLPEMAADGEMRCGGCAAKVGPVTLAGALGRLDRLGRLGRTGTPDDAAIVDEGGPTVRLETVDFFRAFWSDPYVLGRIAAQHAMGDVLAMGGRPELAQAICVIPHAKPRLAGEDLFQLLAGARAAFDPAGVALVGGHTSEGAELAVGFAVSGRAPRDRVLHKGGLVTGQELILTRPIGTGILFAAAMRRKARARDIAAALEEMQRSQADAAEILISRGATAATDVTGFGLGGHLLEMLEASGVGAEIDLGAVPLHDGALALAEAGIASTLLPENLALAHRVSGAGDVTTLALLFDPQTAGGLLAGIPEADCQNCLEALRRAGHRAARIGRVTPAAEPPLTLSGRFQRS